jgi:hypothetical protein
MVKESFVSSINDEGFPDDLTALRKTINHILNYRSYFTLTDVDKYRVNVALPVSPYRDIFHSSSIVTGTQFRNKLSALLKTLDKVADEEQESKQCDLLEMYLVKIFLSARQLHLLRQLLLKLFSHLPE